MGGWELGVGSWELGSENVVRLSEPTTLHAPLRAQSVRRTERQWFGEPSDIASPAFRRTHSDGYPGVMNGLPWFPFFDSLFLPAFFADGALSSINWLWLIGGAVAVSLIVSAMGRRQVRLTDLLRSHVTKNQEANLPPEPTAPTEETKP